MLASRLKLDYPSVLESAHAVAYAVREAKTWAKANPASVNFGRAV